MKMTTFAAESEVVSFAREAVECFTLDPRMTTFSLSSIKKGCMLALKWGLNDDCVLVVKLDEGFEPVVFQKAIPRREEKAE